MKSGMHIETLKPEQQQSPDPVNPIIEHFFSTSLSGSNWRKIDKDSFVKDFEDKLIESRIPLNDKHYIMLKRKLGKCMTMEEVVYALSNHLMGVSI